jgi:hypothetical protein
MFCFIRNREIPIIKCLITLENFNGLSSFIILEFNEIGEKEARSIIRSMDEFVCVVIGDY